MTKNEHVCAICCRSETAGDDIYIENVKTTEGYDVLNFEAVSISRLREKSTSAICVIRRRRQAHLSPIFGINEQKCLTVCTKGNEALALLVPKL